MYTTISVDSFKRTLLFRNDSGFSLGPISRDRRFLAAVKTRTTSDADIYLVELKTGSAKIITAHTGDVNNQADGLLPRWQLATSCRIRVASSRRCGATTSDLGSDDIGVRAAVGRDRRRILEGRPLPHCVRE